MSQVSDNEITSEITDDESENLTDTLKEHHHSPQKCRLWASATDSDETDSSVGGTHIKRCNSQQSSSPVSFRTDRSDSEQSDAAPCRKRQKKFFVRLKSTYGDLATSVKASNMEMFIENVKSKFCLKYQGRTIDCLMLKIDKDDYISLEDVEFSFLNSSIPMTVKVDQSSPINHKAAPVEHTMPPGKQ